MTIDNKILMLSLISSSSEEGWLGITKLQKISFLMEYLLSQNDKRAFDYEFFMHNLGPISTGVYDDYQNLMNEELVIEDEDGIRLSELGESINEEFQNLIPKEINSAMQHVVNEYALLKTKELVRMVHEIKIKLPDGTIVGIGDLPKYSTILPKPLDTIFRLGIGYLETFRILCDRSLTKAIRQARKEGVRSKEYKALVSS